jgi:hypothetical protein
MRLFIAEKPELARAIVRAEFRVENGVNKKTRPVRSRFDFFW